jgi:hypothetical protein
MRTMHRRQSRESESSKRLPSFEASQFKHVPPFTAGTESASAISKGFCLACGLLYNFVEASIKTPAPAPGTASPD